MRHESLPGKQSNLRIIAFLSNIYRNAAWLMLLMICVARLSCEAQDYSAQTGSPTFSVNQPVAYGFVNLANGNVHVEIPLASAPQRGRLAFAAKLVYDSRIWQIVHAGGSLVWKPNNLPLSISGWRFVTNATPGTVTFDATQITRGCNDIDNPTVVNFVDFVWTSPDGTSRKFPVATAQDPGCADDVSSADGYAVDSSGYHMYVTNYSTVVVYAKDGTQVYPKVEDTNGNYFTTDSNGNIIDTLGRTVVQQSTIGNQRFYDVLNSQGTTSRITVTTKQILVRTLFLQPGVSEDQETITVLDKVSFPDGEAYTFGYDEEVIVDPATGAFQPGYGLLTGVSPGGGYSYKNFVDPFGIVNRWAASTIDSSIEYSASPGSILATLSRNGGTEAFGFTLNNGAWLTTATTRIGGHQAQQITNTYDFTQTCPNPFINVILNPCVGPAYIRLLKSVTSDDGGTKQTTYGYDDPRFGNVNLIQNWNYFSGTPPAIPDRKTIITMHPVIGQNILDRVQSVALTDGPGNILSQTNYSYDDAALTTPTHPIINHDASVGTSRGNLTQVSRLAGGTTFLSTNFTYDTTGQVLSVKDAVGNLTTFDYTDNFFNDAGAGQTFGAPNANPSTATNAYPTTITLPIGKVTLGYYYGSGKKAFAVDQNGQQTAQHFTDPLDRLSHTVGPKGWVQIAHDSLFSYDIFTGLNDSQPSTSCTSCIHLTNFVDLQGRVTSSTLASDPDGAATSTALYDIMGNTLTASNPTRTGTGASTNNSFDVLYRLTKTQNPDNSVGQVFYGTDVAAAAGGLSSQLCPSSIYGLGFPIFGINEVGLKSQVWVDGFGRTIESDEPDASNTLSIATCYQYNLGGELTQVVQGDLTRSYKYDPLWRVTQVTTPEAGNLTFSYANDDGSLCSGDPSNACKRVDARGITTRYQYDALNRLTKTTYSDGTPSAFFNYDETSALGVTLTNTVGRPSSTYTKDGTGKILTGEIFSYEPSGSIVNNSQCTPQNCGTGLFQNTYTTDQMGNVVSFDNSWGRSVGAKLNNAGQITAMTVGGSDATHPGTLLSNAKYNAFGAMTLASLGDGSTQAMDYSGARGWLESMRIGSLAAANSPGGNAALPGQGTVTVQGILRQSTGATSGTATLTISGGERSNSNGSGTPGSGTLTINGQEQLKQVSEILPVGGSGTITISGSVQSKQAPVAATAAAGSILISGLLKGVPATAWQDQDVTAITGNTPAGSGSSLSSDGGASGNPIHAYYLGANQHVYSLFWNTATSSWANQDLTAATGNTLAAAGSAVSDLVLADGSTHVFYLGANQHVYQLLCCDATGWLNQDLTAMTGNIAAATGSSLTSLGDSNGAHAFYMGVNQHIYHLAWNTNVGWHNMDVTAGTGNHLAVAGSKLSVSAMPDGTIHLFHVGTDQHIYQLYWNNGGSFGAPFLASSNFTDAQAWNQSAYYTSIRLADVNGDGKADICGRSSGGLICGLNNGAGIFNAATQWEGGFTDAAGWNLPQYGSTMMFADINGDGKADACGRGISSVICEPSTGTSFSASVASSDFTDAQGWNQSAYYTSLRLADVNGDGKPDLCGRGMGGDVCALNTGNGAFGTQTVWDSNFTDAAGWNLPQYGSTMMFADIDGDGKADVCGRGGAGIYCALSTGTGFGTYYLASSDFSDAQAWNAGSYYYGSLRLADVNGDGKPDICGRSSGGTICALNYGNGTFAAVRQWDSSFTDAQGWNFPQYGSTMMFADINGDGKADVCGRGIAGISCELSTGGGGWQSQDLSANSGSSVLAGAGTGIGSIVNAGGCPHVEYIDASQHVNDLYLANISGGCAATWTNQDLTAITGNTLAAAGSPLTDQGGVGDGLNHIFYIGANRHIYRLYWNTAGTLLNQDLTALAGNTAGTGSPLSSVPGRLGNSIDIFSLDSNQHVNHLYLGPGMSYDTGTVNLTITGSPFGSFTASAPYSFGGNNTAALISSALVNDPQTGLNRTGSPVHATLSGTLVNLTALQSGTISNYGLSSTSAFDSAHFSSASFTGTPLTTSMTGGAAATTRTLYDSGTVKVSVGNYTASVPYGQVQVPGTISWNGQDLTTLTGGAQFSVGKPSSFAGDAVSPEHVFFTDANKHVHEQWLDSAAKWHDQDVTIASGSSVTNTCGVVTSFALPGSISLEHVFFVDASQHIREQYTDAIGQWHNRDITSVSGAATTPSGCGVSGFSTPNSSSPEHLVYIDTNGHVHEVWADSTGNWHERDNTVAYGTPAVAQNTNPVFFAGNTSAPEHLLYADANQHIREQYSDSNGLWHDQDLTAIAGGVNTGTNPPSSAAAFFDAGGSEQIFYSGADGDIHHMWNDAAGWHDEDALALSGHSGFVGTGVTLPRSLVAFQGSNGSKHLFYADTAIYHLWNDSNGWQQENLPLEAAVVTAFFDGVNPQVFIATTDMVHFSMSQAPPTYQLVNSTADQIVSALINDPIAGLNVATSPVDVGLLSGTTITLHARQGGQASNFAQSASSVYDTADFAIPSFSESLSGLTLTGGADGITTPLHDSGTLSVNMNNHVNLITWGEGATPQSMASALASDINHDPGSAVTASAQGNIVTFTAKVPGANTNYTYVPNIVHNLVDFPQPSFTFTPSASPAPTLQGGSGGGSTFDTGTITVIANGHSTSINYGRTDTFLADLTGIYTRLASAINSDPHASIWACCTGTSSPLILTSKRPGTAGNYPISVISATNNTNFTGTSFPASLSGVALSGGGDSTGAAFSDDGVATLSIGSFTVSVGYGPSNQFQTGCCGISTPILSTNAAGIATALVQAINNDPNAPVIATASASNANTPTQISLIAKSGGAATNYSLTSSLVSNDPAHFPSPSFVMMPANAALTGGADKPNAQAASQSMATLSFGFGAPVSSSSSGCGINLTINGTPYSPCLNTSNPGPADFASAVANTINTTLNSPVTATASGSNVVIQSVTAGASTTYPITASVAGGSIGVVTSGPTLSGGTDGAAGGSNSFVYALDVGMDPSGTVFEANDSVNGNWSYLYDNLNRLQQASTPTIGYTYDYDRYGNRLHQTPVNGGNALSLLYVNNQISATGVTYDASGNMTSDGNHTYAYDAENRLISVDNGQTATYTYNADGQRIRSTANGTSVDFVYDLSGQAVGVLRPDGTLIRQEIGGLATYSDKAYFHHRDWLGNLRVVTDQTGSIQQTCTNLPYGDGLTCTSAGITPTNFTSYTRDTETNLDFANARYYTSQYGRFMSVDPLGGNVSDPQSLNPYAYVGNGPLSATDSSGMSIDDPVGNIWLIYSGASAASGGPSIWGFSTGPFSFHFSAANSILQPGTGVGGSFALCGLIAGCGGSFDSGPPPPSKAQLGAEAAFNKWPGMSSSSSGAQLSSILLSLACLSGCLKVGGGPSPLEEWLGPGATDINPVVGFATTNDIPWSSSTVSGAASKLLNGTKEVTVANKSQAGELFLRLFQGEGYRNATGMSATETKNFFGSKTGTYHWDTTSGHGPNNPHGKLPHLQIHTTWGDIIRIFFKE